MAVDEDREGAGGGGCSGPLLPTREAAEKNLERTGF